MTAPIMPQSGDSRIRPKVDGSRLWPGGIATAIVAALVALVGILVCRWLFRVPILAPRQDGAYGDAHTTGMVLAAAAAALIATGLAHLLLLSTPRPLTFFAWIVGLVTVVVVLFPFSTGAPLSEKVATAAVDLVIGFAIGSLVSGVAARSIPTPGAARRSGANAGRCPRIGLAQLAAFAGGPGEDPPGHRGRRRVRPGREHPAVDVGDRGVVWRGQPGQLGQVTGQAQRGVRGRVPSFVVALAFGRAGPAHRLVGQRQRPVGERRGAARERRRVSAASAASRAGFRLAGLPSHQPP